mgnify:CR=1 FL=1
MMPASQILTSRFHGLAIAVALGLRRKNRKKPPPPDPHRFTAIRDPETGE